MPDRGLKQAKRLQSGQLEQRGRTAEEQLASQAEWGDLVTLPRTALDFKLQLFFSERFHLIVLA